MSVLLDAGRNIEQRVTKGRLRDMPKDPMVYKKLRRCGGEHSSIYRGLADPKMPFPIAAIHLPPINIHIF
jgi:hypothetical protein